MLTRLHARIDVDLLRRVDKARGDMDRTQFIVEALKEKLARKIKEDKDEHATDVFIDEMIALHPKRRMADIQNGNDLIFKELKKQNEVLKILLRRLTTVNNVSCTTLLNSTNDKTVQDLVEDAKETVIQDLKNINLLGD